MDAVTQEALTILCDALQVEALPVLDVMRVQRWTQLPGFTPEGLRRIVKKRSGRKVSSASYFEAAVSEAFAVPLPPEKPLPRLRSEGTWTDYVAAWAMSYGSPDVGQTEWLRDRWEGERRLLGLPLEETDREDEPLGDGVSAGTPIDPPLPLAA